MKRCSACRLELPLDCFSTRSASPDGLAYKCRGCSRTYLKTWKAINHGAFKRWASVNERKQRERFSEWVTRNRDNRAAYMRQWAQSNAGYVNAKCARRSAAKLRAVPSWADQVAIRAIYAEANQLTRETGIRHEVDHIYPLQGELVCGLHCEANLQILTKVENIRKLNRMPVLDEEPRARDDGK